MDDLTDPEAVVTPADADRLAELTGESRERVLDAITRAGPTLLAVLNLLGE